MTIAQALKKAPRKLQAFVLTSAFILVAGWTMTADKLTAVTLALTAAFTAFVGGHAATDIAATRTSASTKPKTEPTTEDEEGS